MGEAMVSLYSLRRSLLMIVVLVGCRQPTDMPSGATIDSNRDGDIEARAALEKGVSTSQLLTASCSSAADVVSNLTERAWVLSVNARQCLSCQQVGFLVRSIERVAKMASEDVVVAVNATDSTLICDFLRQEKSNALVALLRNPVLPLAQVLSDGRFTWVCPKSS